MRLTCKQIKRDVATTNGRVYSREALARIVALSNQQSLDGSNLLVADQTPDSAIIALANTAGKVGYAMLVDDQHIEIDVELLDTPKGAALKAAAPGLVEKVYSVVPVLLGNTENGMNIDPYSIKFYGWAIVR
jgi:hypothetical protein